VSGVASGAPPFGRRRRRGASRRRTYGLECQPQEVAGEEDESHTRGYLRGSCQLGTESDGGGEVASRRDGVGTVGRTERGGGAGVSSDSWISRRRLDLFSLKIVDMQYCFFIRQMGAKHPTNCLYYYRWYIITRRSKRNENYNEVM
jgi:hypothetical protein